jgi:hypothetical protein
VLEKNGDGSKQAHSANGPKTNTQNEKQAKSAGKEERKAGGRAEARAGHESNQAWSRIQRRRAEHVYSNNMQDEKPGSCAEHETK